MLVVRNILFDKSIISIHSHAVGIREYPNIALNRGRMLTDAHGGAYLKHGFAIALRFVNGRRHLMITEHIRNAVIADPIAASEILMGVIIRKAPSKATANIGVSGYVVDYSRVTEGVLKSVPLVIEAFGWEHMPVIFGYQIRLFYVRGDSRLGLASRSLSVVEEVVVGVNVL